MSKESEGQADGDDDEDMQEQEVIEGYRFGKVYVPLEKNADSFPTSSGLSVLQFTPRNDIPRFHFMSSVAAVVPRNDPTLCVPLMPLCVPSSVIRRLLWLGLSIAKV